MCNVSNIYGDYRSGRNKVSLAKSCNLVLYCTALHCTAMKCTELQCSALHCTAMHYTALHFTSLKCTALHLNCPKLHWTAPHCIAVHCTALNYTALYQTLKSFSNRRPSGPMLSISQFFHMCVCLCVCLCVCSLSRYRLNFFLPPLLKVGCPTNFGIRNSWEKLMERSGVTFENFY